MAKRRALNVDVTAESYEGWESFARANGVTMTAAAEALGLMLGAGMPERVQSELLTIARQITAERRSRR